MTTGIGLPGTGIMMPSGGGSPVPQPIVKQLTFGYNQADISALGNDTFPNVYMIVDGSTSNTDGGAYIRAMEGDVLTKLSIAVGDTVAGTVTVGVYSADTVAGPWTLAKQQNIAVAPTGTNIRVDAAVNVPLTKGKYYYLTVTSATANVVQLAYTGGLKRYTGADPLPATLTGAGTTSNFLIILFGTITRTIQP